MVPPYDALVLARTVCSLLIIPVAIYVVVMLIARWRRVIEARTRWEALRVALGRRAGWVGWACAVYILVVLGVEIALIGNT